MEENTFTPPPRECGECTMCCQGWLHADALGKPFFPGQPCHWVNKKGCTVYKDRPQVCSSFKCAWIEDHSLPEWFRPDEINSISIWDKWKEPEVCEEGENGLYLRFVEGSAPLPMEVIAWLSSYIQCRNLNVMYTFRGQPRWMGSEEFSEWCREGSGEPLSAADYQAGPYEEVTTKPH